MAEEGLTALQAIHWRANYDLIPDVILVTNAMLNSLKRVLSSEGPLNVSLVLSPTHITKQPAFFGIPTKEAITNASFKTQLLPEDIDVDDTGLSNRPNNLQNQFQIDPNLDPNESSFSNQVDSRILNSNIFPTSYTHSTTKNKMRFPGAMGRNFSNFQLNVSGFRKKDANKHIITNSTNTNSINANSIQLNQQDAALSSNQTTLFQNNITSNFSKKSGFDALQANVSSAGGGVNFFGRHSPIPKHSLSVSSSLSQQTGSHNDFSLEVHNQQTSNVLSSIPHKFAKQDHLGNIKSKLSGSVIKEKFGKKSSSDKNSKIIIDKSAEYRDDIIDWEVILEKNIQQKHQLIEEDMNEYYIDYEDENKDGSYKIGNFKAISKIEPKHVKEKQHTDHSLNSSIEENNFPDIIELIEHQEGKKKNTVLSFKKTSFLGLKDKTKTNIDKTGKLDTDNTISQQSQSTSSKLGQVLNKAVKDLEMRVKGNKVSKDNKESSNAKKNSSTDGFLNEEEENVVEDTEIMICRSFSKNNSVSEFENTGIVAPAGQDIVKPTISDDWNLNWSRVDIKNKSITNNQNSKFDHYQNNFSPASITAIQIGASKIIKKEKTNENFNEGINNSITKTKKNIIYSSSIENNYTNNGNTNKDNCHMIKKIAGFVPSLSSVDLINPPLSHNSTDFPSFIGPNISVRGGVHMRQTSLCLIPSYKNISHASKKTHTFNKFDKYYGSKIDNDRDKDEVGIWRESFHFDEKDFEDNGLNNGLLYEDVDICGVRFEGDKIKKVGEYISSGIGYKPPII